MHKLPTALAVLILVTSCFGCAEQERYVRSSGSHAVNYSFMEKSRKYIVWSNHSPERERESTVNAAITQYLQSAHQTVVERSKLDAVFQEQRLRLMHTPDDEAQLLRVGKLIGADQIIFADSKSTSDHGGYLVSVRVRAVDVETAAILWSGSAWVIDALVSDEDALANMPKVAIRRALCPLEVAGVRWMEYGNSVKAGCITN